MAGRPSDGQAIRIESRRTVPCWDPGSLALREAIGSRPHRLGAMFDYAARRSRLAEKLEAEGIDALFLAPSADLEYLTGVERHIPSFGESSYAHGWVTGAFFRPGAEPVFVVPRMFAAFDLREQPEGELVVVNETDDGNAIFERVARERRRLGNGRGRRPGLGRDDAEPRRILGADRLRTGSALVNELRRVKTGEELEAMGRAIATVEKAMAATAPLVVPGVSMAELVEAVEHELRLAGSRCPSFTTHIFTGLGAEDLDSGEATARLPIPEGTSVMFDFGGVVDGYCSDFGRTIYCGEPPAGLPRRLRGDARRAGGGARRRLGRARRPARSTPPAARPIEEAGLGEHFRHRMGHGIGMDVHERPFISTEDDDAAPAPG